MRQLNHNTGGNAAPVSSLCVRVLVARWTPNAYRAVPLYDKLGERQMRASPTSSADLSSPRAQWKRGSLEEVPVRAESKRGEEVVKTNQSALEASVPARRIQAVRENVVRADEAQPGDTVPPSLSRSCCPPLFFLILPR